MKKVFSLVIATVLLLSVMCIAASANYGYSYKALKGTPVIDGVIDDIWNDASIAVADVNHAYSSDTLWDDATMKVKILWDEEALYFLIVGTAAAEQGASFANLAEIYISEGTPNADGSYSARDSQTCIRFNDGTFVKADELVGSEGPGTNTKGLLKGAASTAWTEGDAYYIEARLPFATLTDGANAGLVMGVEFMLNILDGSRSFKNALRWNVDTANAIGEGADKAPWQSTDPWGVLVLSDEVAAAPLIEEPSSEATSKPADTSSEKPTTGTGDNGIAALAVIAVIAVAGAVVIKKTR